MSYKFLKTRLNETYKEMLQPNYYLGPATNFSKNGILENKEMIEQLENHLKLKINKDNLIPAIRMNLILNNLGELYQQTANSLSKYNIPVKLFLKIEYQFRLIKLITICRKEFADVKR